MSLGFQMYKSKQINDFFNLLKDVKCEVNNQVNI